MFKLIVLSQPDFHDGEIDTLLGLFENGLELFHLRKPTSSSDEMKHYIDSIPKIYHNRIVIHSNYSLATECVIKGIHCTSMGRDEFYEYEDFPIQKSISTHGFCEAGMVDESFAYAFISPIFDSVSKPGYEQGYQHDALKDFLSRPRRTEYIALGGVTAENILLCKQMGFDGVAMIGTIWNDAHPVDQFKTLLSLTQSL
jgi:thiamine-phosphate pyrophosphorylase